MKRNKAREKAIELFNGTAKIMKTEGVMTKLMTQKGIDMIIETNPQADLNYWDKVKTELEKL